MDGTDLHLVSLRKAPDKSWKTMYRGLVHRVVNPFTPSFCQYSLTDPGWMAVRGGISIPQP